MPVFRDFEAASVVCRAVDEQVSALVGVEARVLLVDDGSPAGQVGWAGFAPRGLSRIDVLVLKRNLGHQRAIAVALCHLYDAVPCDAVLVMDADGEDRAEDIPRLLAELRRTPGSMVFAERRKRLEGLVFRAGYFFYRLLHRALTGVPVRVGNFSVLPASALPRLVCMSELWNHYAGAALRSRLPQVRLPTDRGSRAMGRSQMGGLIALVMHGIGGIATFHDVVATRLLVASLGVVGALAAALLGVVGIRFATTLAIPGWATYTAGLLLVLSIQVASVAFSLVLSLISTRTSATFLPCRDYSIFVSGTLPLGARGAA
ncbi:MAG TPA: glycosyltransferase [Polyangiaceae bacterium]|nr:glycosyltransferase [Polyangiaceae bacterium]